MEVIEPTPEENRNPKRKHTDVDQENSVKRIKNDSPKTGSPKPEKRPNEIDSHHHNNTKKRAKNMQDNWSHNNHRQESNSFDFHARRDIYGDDEDDFLEIGSSYDHHNVHAMELPDHGFINDFNNDSDFDDDLPDS